MTKLYFEYEEIGSKLIPQVTSAIDMLDKASSLSSSVAVPSGFNATNYNDAVGKIRKASTNLKEICQDLENANKNFENAEANSIKNNSDFEYDLKIDKVDPLIKIN